MPERWTAVRLQEVGSTNETAKEYIRQGAPDGTLIVTEKQTAGKGRRGRVWQDRPGESLSMSLILRPPFPAEKASMTTLVTAVAVARAVDQVLPLTQAGRPERELHFPKAGIKWPNDVLLSEKKVCGILTELIFDEERPCLIIGVGVNVNNRNFPEDIADTATSLYLVSGATDRDELMKRIWTEFYSLYDVFCGCQDMSFLRDEYESRLVNLGRVCCFTDGKGSRIKTGTALGIDDCGRLVVRLEDGTRAAVDAGEVSVRGIYGYV